MPDIAQVMCDPHAAGDEQDGAVAVEAGGEAVGSLEEGADGDAVAQVGGGVFGGVGVEVLREAVARSDEEGEGWEVGLLDGFFDVVVGCDGVWAREGGEGFVGPGHAEGMGGPEAGGGDCDVDVLAGFVCPGSGGGDGYSDGVARKSFDGGAAGSSSDTSV